MLKEIRTIGYARLYCRDNVVGRMGLLKRYPDGSITNKVSRLHAREYLNGFVIATMKFIDHDPTSPCTVYLYDLVNEINSLIEKSKLDDTEVEHKQNLLAWRDR